MTGAGTNYCGCCGRPTRNSFWCSRCTAHIAPADRSLWDRTWFAQHGQPCPFEAKRPRITEETS